MNSSIFLEKLIKNKTIKETTNKAFEVIYRLQIKNAELFTKFFCKSFLESK